MRDPFPLQISCPLEYGDAHGVIVPLQDAVIIIAVQYSHWVPSSCGRIEAEPTEAPPQYRGPASDAGWV